jgi:hypothetical protein
MDIKYIINICLILFVLHIIIINLNFNVKIGNVENFKNNDDKNKKSNDKKSNVDFLMSDKDSSEDFKKKLLKYIQLDENEEKTEKNEFEKKNVSDILASNTYVGNDNVPNFESNVADISKFYNMSFDNMNEDDLRNATPISSKKLEPVKLKDNDAKDANCVTKTGRKSIDLPNSWEYKNELPMNGGNMNGIFGFDNLDSQFASFNDTLNLQESTDNNFNNIPHNDLRKPIVYN